MDDAEPGSQPPQLDMSHVASLGTGSIAFHLPAGRPVSFVALSNSTVFVTRMLERLSFAFPESNNLLKGFNTNQSEPGTSEPSRLHRGHQRFGQQLSMLSFPGRNGQLMGLSSPPNHVPLMTHFRGPLSSSISGPPRRLVPAFCQKSFLIHCHT